MDIKIIDTFDDSSAIAQLEKLEQTLKGLGGESAEFTAGLQEGMRDALQEAGLLDEQLDKTAKSMDKAAKAANETKKELTGWKGAIADVVGEQTVLGRTMNDWKQTLDKVKAGQSAAAAGTEGLSKSQRVLNTILKASPIFLLVGVISAIVAYMSRFQEATDKVARVWEGLSAAFNVALDALAGIGKGLVSFLSGDFGKGFDEIGEAVSGMGGKMTAAASAAAALEGRLQSLRDIQIETAAMSARQRVEIEKLKQVADDEAKSTNARVGALQRAAAIQEELNRRSVAQAREAFDILREQNDLKTRTADDRKAEAEKEIELIEAEAEAERASADIRKQIGEIRREAHEKAQQQAAERAKLVDDEAKRLAKLRAEYERMKSSILESIRAGEIDAETGLRKIGLEYADKLRELKEKQGDAIAKAAEAGLEFDLGPAFTELETQLRAEYDKLAAQFEVKPVAPLKVLRRSDADVVAALALFGEPEETFLEKVLNLRDKIVSSLGLTEQQAADLFKGATEAFQSFLDSSIELTNAELEYQNRVVDALDERLEKQKQVVDEERNLKAQGLANNVSAEQAELQRITAIRNTEEKKRLELEKKIAQQRLIADSAQQVSGLVTAGVNVLKAESSKGLIGILFSLGAIATMFGIIAQAKANAKKFAEIPKFRKGGRAEGARHEDGGILARVGGRDFLELEGQEWIVNREESRRHDRFLENLNAGRYRGVNLERVVENAASTANFYDGRGGVARAGFLQAQESANLAKLEELRQAYRAGAAEIVQAIREETVFPYKNGYIRTVRKDGTVRREVVLPED